MGEPMADKQQCTVRVGLREGSKGKDALSLDLKTVLEATADKVGSAYVKHVKANCTLSETKQKGEVITRVSVHKPGNSRLQEAMSSELFTD